MYCRYCGKELPKDSNFCPNCGANQKENAAKRYSKMKKFFSNHKILMCFYLVWCLIHIGLFLFSTPKGYKYVLSFDFEKGEDVGSRVDFDLSNGFYPFNVSLSNVFQGTKHTFSLLKNVDVYDSTELFFYTILIPVIILEIVCCFPFLFSFFKKIKARYSQRKKDNNVNIKEDESNDINDKKENVDVSEEYSDITQPIAQVSNDEILEEQILSEDGVKKMSLFHRFMGSIIDKVFILLLFFVVIVTIRPYWLHRLGTYFSLFNSPTTVYKNVDIMEKYGTNHDNDFAVYKAFMEAKLAPLYTGPTKEADKDITFSFIVFNLLYYLFTEGIMSASLGKRMFDGELNDAFGDKIDFDKALKRALCKGAIMLILVYVIHWGLTFSNLIAVISFFLIMDVPVLFFKRSLLDKLTGTTYVKR